VRIFSRGFAGRRKTRILRSRKGCEGKFAMRRSPLPIVDQSLGMFLIGRSNEVSQTLTKVGDDHWTTLE